MMSVDRLNAPGADRATGLTAPLIRAAAHVGYILGYLDEVGDDGWNAGRTEMVEDISRELEEANRHLRDSLVAEENPFISEPITALFTSLRVSIDGLRANTPQDRADVLRDLQNLNHNIAYIGSRVDHDTAGIACHEGLVT